MSAGEKSKETEEGDENPYHHTIKAWRRLAESGRGSHGELPSGCFRDVYYRSDYPRGGKVDGKAGTTAV